MSEPNWLSQPGRERWSWKKSSQPESGLLVPRSSCGAISSKLAINSSDYTAMKEPLPTISFLNLAIGLLPVALVIVLIQKWALDIGTALWAVVRMLVQLLAVGYVLEFIFKTDQPIVILGVLLMMVSAAAWIALGPVRELRSHYYGKAWLAIAIGGGCCLVLITQGVLSLEPWFKPRYMVPLGGMTFSVAMNSVSIAAERFFAERDAEADYGIARQAGMRAALIPITNSLLSVGLVALPGMMTGQILAGTDPLVAARYQIMVMGMMFGSGGLSAGCFLILLKPSAAESS